MGRRAELTGAFGDPMDSNLTEVATEAVYQDKGLNYRYLTVLVRPDDLEDAVRGIRAMNMKGMNLTMPHKIKVIPMLDELSEAASVIGAVNTIIVREDGSLLGENTDGKGFVQALGNEGVSVDGKNITILGAGGAARAIAVECALAGAASVTIMNRTFSRAQELADTLIKHTKTKAHAIRWDKPVQQIPADTDILINATSISMDGPNKPDIDYNAIRSDMVTADVCCRPEGTPFLQEAAKRGAKAIDGIGMLACQGVMNIKLWTGVDASPAVFADVVRQELTAKN